jgi:hypothetical protein
MRKLVNIDRSALEALELLARDRKVKLQDLIDEAIADLLKKHRRPVGVRAMFAQSLEDSGLEDSGLEESGRKESVLKVSSRARTSRSRRKA